MAPLHVSLGSSHVAKQTQWTHLCHQLPLYFQLLVQLILPLFKGDAAAALAVLDPDAPVVYFLQEAAGTQLIFDPQHSSSDGQDRHTRLMSRIVPSGHRKERKSQRVFRVCGFILCVSPVEVENVVEDLRISIKEELVALDDVVITQVQLLAVVCVCSQAANACFWILGS